MADQNDYILVYDSTPMINVETKEYPVYFYEMRTRFPNSSFPIPCRDTWLVPFGYAPVLPSEKPEGDVITQGEPELREDGHWYVTWQVRDFTEEELVVEIQRRKDLSISTAKSVFEEDLNRGLPFTYEGSIYTTKIRPFDITTLIAMKDLAQRNADETFLLNSQEEIISGLNSQAVISTVNQIIDNYNTLVQDYWQFISQVKASTTLDEIPDDKETFIVYPESTSEE